MEKTEYEKSCLLAQSQAKPITSFSGRQQHGIKYEQTQGQQRKKKGGIYLPRTTKQAEAIN